MPTFNSLESARSVRTFFFNDLNSRAKSEDASPAPTQDHIQNTLQYLKEAYNLAVAAGDVVAIAIIDTLTLPLRQQKV